MYANLSLGHETANIKLSMGLPYEEDLLPLRVFSACPKCARSLIWTILKTYAEKLIVTDLFWLNLAFPRNLFHQEFLNSCYMVH